MNNIDIMLKCILLLYREKDSRYKSVDNSNDLVKTIISLFKDNRALLGSETTLLTELKFIINNMINNPDSYDKDTLLQSLEIILKDKPTVYKSIEKMISTEISENALNKSILTLRSFLNDYYKDEQIKNIISNAHYAITANKLNGKSIREYTSEIIASLENYISVSKYTDPAILDEIDVSETSVMSNILNIVKDQSIGISKLKCGFKGLNRMTQGGFRRGEFVMICALPHNFKSGLAQELTLQFAMYNVPKLDDETKKPLIVYISCEDDSTVFTEFMYKYLYYEEFGKNPDLSIVTSTEIAEYIKKRVSINGYNVKLLRINPSLWTYKDLINKILEFEAHGYEVHACIVDYLSKIPTTGCDRSGPPGTDVRDMFNRIRNFMGSKRILFITPHQLSTDAKNLIRNGIPEANFVKEIANKGYTELSKQLDQVVDLELYIHIAKINKKPHLCIQRGKHRTPSILDEENFYITIPFPYKAPLMPDINKEDNDIKNNTPELETDEIFELIK